MRTITTAATSQASTGHPEGRHELAHLAAIGGEHDERDDRERKLHAEDDLAQDEQLARSRRAIEHGRDGGRDDGEPARRQPARPRRQPHVDEAFHHDLAGQRGGDGRVEAAAQQRHAEQRGCPGGAQQRGQELLGVLQIGYAVLAGLVKGRGRKDEDRGVDQQRQHERDRRIDGRKLDRLALGRQRVGDDARLHDGGVQVEIMRHHGRAENAHGEVEHLRVAHDLDRRREAEDHLAHVGLRHGDLDGEAGGDHQQRAHDEGLDPAKAEVLQIKDQEDIERGNEHAELERDAEQQIETDRGADDLGHVGRADGDLRQHPEDVADGLGEGVAAGLRQVAARRKAEPRAQRLQQDRHQVGEQRDRKQRVAELGAAGERRRPVAGVHVADGDEVARAEEGEERRQPVPVHRDRAPHLAQRGLAAGAAPARADRHGIRRLDHVVHRSLPTASPASVGSFGLIANDLQLQK